MTIRTTMMAVLCSVVPATACAATQCQAAPHVGHDFEEQVTPHSSLQSAGRAFTPSEIEASPVLQRLASHGAQLFDRGRVHGLQSVFAVQGEQFQMFYITPDQSAEIGGVMWDSQGHNITRTQTDTIAGVVPTIHLAEHTPAPNTRDDYARLASSHYGIIGDPKAKRVYMIIDPLCPFSTSAFDTLKPVIDAKKISLAVIPIAINDHENNGASSPAARSLLNHQQMMASQWQKIRDLGRSPDLNDASPEAASELVMNMAAAHDVGLKGTPTFVWEDKSGVKLSAGLPDDITQLTGQF